MIYKQINIDDIKPDPEFAMLVPQVTHDERVAMGTSINEKGIQMPLTIDAKNRTLYDGYTRYDIAQKLGLKTVPVIEKTFVNRSEAKAFVIENVLERRHLNIPQKVYLGMKLLPIIMEMKKKRGKLPAGSKARAGEIVAAKVGLPARTFYRGVSVFKKAVTKNPDMIDRMMSGKLEIGTAEKMLMQHQRSLPTAKLPPGKSDIILVDPPTKFSRGATVRGSADNHYETMTPEQILSWLQETQIAKTIADNAIMFLWLSTSIQYTLVDVSYQVPGFLEGHEILSEVKIKQPFYQVFLERLGFAAPDSEFAWVKDKIGMGSKVRNQHEKCLIAVKGKMPLPAKLFSSVIQAPRGEHSRKPEIYELIESMYPGRNYCEWFHRGKDKRKHWKFHGNEA